MVVSETSIYHVEEPKSVLGWLSMVVHLPTFLELAIGTRPVYPNSKGGRLWSLRSKSTDPCLAIYPCPW